MQRMPKGTRVHMLRFTINSSFISRNAYAQIEWHFVKYRCYEGRCAT